MEVLVALAILSIGVGLVVVSFGQLADRDLDNQARTITAWMQSLADRSVLEGGLYGFRVAGDQLQAVSWFDHQWLVVEHEGLLILPENIRFRLGEDQASVGFIFQEDLAEPKDAGDGAVLFQKQELVEPLMVFMPSGEPMADGELLLQSSAEAALAIAWTVEGEISYEDRLPI